MLTDTVRELRAIFGWLDGRLRLRWALLVPVVSVAALLEAVGALAVFGLLRLVVEPHRVRITPGVSEIWLAWPTDDPPAIVGLLIVLVALFYVLRAAYLAAVEWLKESTIARSAAKAGDRLFARYLAADYLFHLQRRSSSPSRKSPAPRTSRFSSWQAPCSTSLRSARRSPLSWSCSR